MNPKSDSKYTQHKCRYSHPGTSQVSELSKVTCERPVHSVLCILWGEGWQNA